MSVRVTSISDAGQTVLRIDGRLMSEDVAELAGQFTAAERPHVLDLSDLQSADATSCTKQTVKPAAVAVTSELGGINST